MLHVCSDLNGVVKNIVAKIEKDRAIGVLTWPTDTIGILLLCILDIKHGRSFSESVTASWLRWCNGLSGIKADIHLHQHTKIMQAIKAHLYPTLCIENERVIEDCQHMLLLKHKDQKRNLNYRRAAEWRQE
jgi:hypothetical protein